MTKKKKDAPAPPEPAEMEIETVAVPTPPVEADAPAPDPASSPVLHPVPKAKPASRVQRRLSMRSGAAASKRPVDLIASATKTRPVVLAAIKAAYGWTERTRLTQAEFLRKRDNWLKKPASEV